MGVLEHEQRITGRHRRLACSISWTVADGVEAEIRRLLNTGPSLQRALRSSPAPSLNDSSAPPRWSLSRSCLRVGEQARAVVCADGGGNPPSSSARSRMVANPTPAWTRSGRPRPSSNLDVNCVVVPRRIGHSLEDDAVGRHLGGGRRPGEPAACLHRHRETAEPRHVLPAATNKRVRRM